jgi:hypothetical protein
MKTFHYIKSLDTTIVLTDKTEFQGLQSSIRLTNKRKLDILGRVDKVENELMHIASIERKKSKKQQFFNKHKQ